MKTCYLVCYNGCELPWEVYKSLCIQNKGTYLGTFRISQNIKVIGGYLFFSSEDAKEVERKINESSN